MEINKLVEQAMTLLIFKISEEQVRDRIKELIKRGFLAMVDNEIIKYLP